MNHHLHRILAAVGVIAMLVAGAHAQNVESMSVNVPFHFIAENTVLPPGTYAVAVRRAVIHFAEPGESQPPQAQEEKSVPLGEVEIPPGENRIFDASFP